MAFLSDLADAFPRVSPPAGVEPGGAFPSGLTGRIPLDLTSHSALGSIVTPHVGRLGLLGSVNLAAAAVTFCPGPSSPPPPMAGCDALPPLPAVDGRVCRHWLMTTTMSGACRSATNGGSDAASRASVRPLSVASIAAALVRVAAPFAVAARLSSPRVCTATAKRTAAAPRSDPSRAPISIVASANTVACSACSVASQHRDTGNSCWHALRIAGVGAGNGVGASSAVAVSDEGCVGGGFPTMAANSDTGSDAQVAPGRGVPSSAGPGARSAPSHWSHARPMCATEPRGSSR
mmetsp:Transcript_16407/g.40373  ORF Transcript_16407/g.40373 Transcript_16407/m.40373 type:complete len:291 (+) Transcript_16407:757-1629(+)